MAPLPEPERATSVVRSPGMVRAAVSPTAIVAAGGGVAIGELAHLGIAWAVVVGAGAWAIRMVGALVSTTRRRRRLAQPIVVDPWAVPEPWKGLVAQAVAARDRFAQAIAAWRPGPLHDRLAPLSAQVTAATAEVFRVAQQAAALSRAVVLADPGALGDQLRQLQAQRASRAPGQSAPVGSDEREAALAAQLKSVRAMETTADQIEARLRLLIANLNDMVTTVTAISLDASASLDGQAGPAAERLAGSLEAVLGELKILQQAVRESETLPPAGARS